MLAEDVQELDLYERDDGEKRYKAATAELNSLQSSTLTANNNTSINVNVKRDQAQKNESLCYKCTIL